MTDNINRHLRHNPIAIIGMGSVFPQAHDLREYWHNIVNAVDCITDVPDSHWRIEDYYDPNPAAPDKTYSKRGGFLPYVDFDPMAFGLPPNILEVTDVSQMLGLVVAKMALSDAGYLNAAQDVRDRTGIVLGVGGGQKLIVPLSSRLQYPVWKRALLSSGISESDADHIIEKIKSAYVPWEENSFPGMLGNVIAGRIANRFDLGGINCVTDAACASSLSALKLALSELLEGRADMMITGGVDTDNSIVMYMNFSKTPAFTPGDIPRPFDAESDGMMVGEGVGMLVLKRLEDAVRDNDRIYAVIKGIGASSDGRFKSIYAPRGEGQEKALQRAYEDAGFSPATVGLFEAHGTGTVAGDATEVTTAIRYLNANDERRQHIAIGSVKSQIGHTKAAAGAAGLIKASLALHHKVLPPTLNVSTPNPKYNITDSAFYINTSARPWVREGDTPRRAGVSAFGFGGTNFHVVLEEYSPDHQNAYRIDQSAQAIIFQAPTPTAIQQQVNQAIEDLRSEDGPMAFHKLIAASHEAHIPASYARLGFVADSIADALAHLNAAAKLLQSHHDADEWHHPRGIFYRRSSLQLKGRVVALFSGQGAQYLNMGRELTLNFPELRHSFQALDARMVRDGQPRLSDVVYPIPAFDDATRHSQEEAIQSTAYAQPAIGAISAGLYRLMTRAGFTADFTAGHSFGELSALWAAGVLEDDDYFELVKARGAAMAPPADPLFDAGTMIAVTGGVEAIKQQVEHLDGVQVANHNSSEQVVLAGGQVAVKNAANVLTQQGYRVVPLSVSAAFHTPLVGHAQKPFAEKLQQVTFHLPQVPVYSNATAHPYPVDPAQMREMLAAHILNPVLFKDEIENLYSAGGYLFVEFGPRSVLTNLVKDILGDRPHIALSLNASRQKDSDRQFREAVVQLQVLGLDLRAVDPYFQVPAAPEGGKPRMKVKINGAAFISPKTRDAHEALLNDGHQVAGGTQIVEKVVEVEKIVEKPIERIVEVPSATEAPVHANNGSAHDPLSAIESTLNALRAHQEEVQRAQEQHQDSQAEYYRIFFELTRQQQSITDPQVAATVSQQMMRFHDHHAETLRLHEVYLREQSIHSQALLNLLREQYASLGDNLGKNGVSAPAVPVASTIPVPVAAAPTPAPPPVPVAAAPAAKSAPMPTPVVLTSAPAPAADGFVAQLSTAMLDIVADKTGYPADMLDLDMDMEADLGIDSIKRVEILGAMRDAFPQLPQFSPDELAELRTLGDIVTYMQQHAGASHSPAPAAPAAAPAEPVSNGVAITPAPAPAAPPAPAADGFVAQLSTAMLDIVADKTGYPADMLDLDMDMEADLGIDSIKRVEILGAMRDAFPQLPQFSPDELAELRTLGDIVTYMQQHAGGSTTASNGAEGGAHPFVDAAIPAASSRVNPAEYGIERRIPQLHTLPRPDHLVFEAVGDVALLTDDGAGFASALADVLTARGWRVVVLSVPADLAATTPSFSPNVQHVQLPDVSESALQAAISQAATQGPISAFAHLHPALSPTGNGFGAADKTLLSLAFLAAKHLKTHLADGPHQARPAFVTLNRVDGKLGTQSAASAGVIGGGLFGLVKTLRLEWAGQVFCRALDIAPALTPDQAAALTLAELHDPDQLISEVGLDGHSRVTLVGQPRAYRTNGVTA